MAIRIGYAAGAFDLFHIGHLNLLENARSRCDYLIAGVVSDEILMVTKGRAPVIPLAERLRIVAGIRTVDQVYADDNLQKVDSWRQLGFNVFFKGDDWRNTDKGEALERQFEPLGVRVEYFPYTLHTSSSLLRQALEASSSRHEGAASGLMEARG
ncbi:adenylyltransferase/cytidyltransferase family protein [Arthrobacter sp. CP30]